ncbi:MAG: SEC-C domain-containing protein [Chloroflexi bacterium]|nr:SEC-C domain-containing protein [Chloroflexota bacterium]
MPRKLSRNAPCPCGSGKKYKHCCIRKDFEWVETDDGDIARRVEVPEEVMQALEGLRQAQVAKFGREPERIFEGAPPFELVEHWTVEAMKKAGVDPALIYAFEKTGFVLNDQSENKLPDTEIAEWEAAISEYEKKTGQKATRRRLSDQDFEGIMRNGPKQTSRQLPSQLVERLPFPPPFTKEVWGQRHLRDIIEEPEYFDYFQRCLTEVVRSGRADTYLNMFLMMAHCDSTSRKELYREDLLEVATNRHFSAEELKRALESVAISFGPKGAMPNAAAAFEFLAFIGDSINSYAEHLGIQDQLNDSLVKINSFAMLAFVAAVNVELGMRDDIWTA